MTSAPTGKNNRSNPYYAKLNHIKLAKIDRNRSEFFGTIGGVPDSPVSISGLLTDSLGRYAQIDTALTYTLTEGTATAQSWTVDGALKATTAGYTPVAADNAGIVDVSVTIGGEQFTASNPAQVRYAQATAANVIPSQSWTVGEAITPLDASVNFTIPTGNTGTYSSTNLPPNLIINAQSGVITGTVANEGSGNINVRFTDDYGRVTSSTFAWSATAALAAPQVTASSSVSGRTVTVTITNLTGNPLPTTTCTGNVTWSGPSGGPYTYTAPSSDTGTIANWTVTATNSEGSDNSSGSETVPADLFSPAITTDPIISNTSPTVGDGLTATPGNTTGSPTPSNEYEWRADGAIVQAYNSSTLYVVQLADEGKVITVTQRASNGVGSPATRTSAATNAVVHVAPVAGGALQDQSFINNTGNQTYNVSFDFTGEDLVYTVQTGPAGVTVNSSTGLVTFDTNTLNEQAGTPIVIRATNSGGFADSGFSLTIAAAATAPIITGVPTITGTTTVGQTLTATPASVSGNPTPARTWQWERNNTPIPGATSSTYVLALADEGNTLTVVQTETNSEGADSAESVATATIVHVAPVAAGLLLDQSFTDDTGNQTYDVSGDFTGENLVYSVQTGPVGVTVDSSSGVVTFDTNALAVQSSTSIVIRATNSGGFADSGFSLDITSAGTTPDTPPVSVTYPTNTPPLNKTPNVFSYGPVRWQQSEGNIWEIFVDVLDGTKLFLKKTMSTNGFPNPVLVSNAAWLGIDNHIEPCLWINPITGNMHVIVVGHNGTNADMYISTDNTFTAFGPAIDLVQYTAETRLSYNQVLVHTAEAAGRVYFEFRVTNPAGSNYSRNILRSDDGGTTWGNELKIEEESNERPYYVYALTGAPAVRNRTYFATSGSQPYDGPQNYGVYVGYIEDGVYYDMAGVAKGTGASAPAATDFTQVYTPPAGYTTWHMRSYIDSAGRLCGGFALLDRGGPGGNSSTRNWAGWFRQDTAGGSSFTSEIIAETPLNWVGYLGPAIDPADSNFAWFDASDVTKGETLVRAQRTGANTWNLVDVGAYSAGTYSLALDIIPAGTTENRLSHMANIDKAGAYGRDIRSFTNTSVSAILPAALPALSDPKSLYTLANIGTLTGLTPSPSFIHDYTEDATFFDEREQLARGVGSEIDVLQTSTQEVNSRAARASAPVSITRALLGLDSQPLTQSGYSMPFDDAGPYWMFCAYVTVRAATFGLIISQDHSSSNTRLLQFGVNGNGNMSAIGFNASKGPLFATDPDAVILNQPQLVTAYYHPTDNQVVLRVNGVEKARSTVDTNPAVKNDGFFTICNRRRTNTIDGSIESEGIDGVVHRLVGFKTNCNPNDVSTIEQWVGSSL